MSAMGHKQTSHHVRATGQKRKGPAIPPVPSLIRLLCYQPLVTTGGGGALPLPTP